MARNSGSYHGLGAHHGVADYRHSLSGELRSVLAADVLAGTAPNRLPMVQVCSILVRGDLCHMRRRGHHGCPDAMGNAGRMPSRRRVRCILTWADNAHEQLGRPDRTIGRSGQAAYRGQ